MVVTTNKHMNIILEEKITKRGGVFIAPNGKTYASAKDYFEGGNPTGYDVGTAQGTDSSGQANEAGEGEIKKEN